MSWTIAFSLWLLGPTVEAAPPALRQSEAQAVGQANEPEEVVQFDQSEADRTSGVTRVAAEPDPHVWLAALPLLLLLLAAGSVAWRASSPLPRSRTKELQK